LAFQTLPDVNHKPIKNHENNITIQGRLPRTKPSEAHHGLPFARGVRYLGRTAKPF